ncbi:protein NRT1/ PTR FAMILY 3.1-like [Oryza brachyantha]|uniref:protein NRT1/ PTR FAMILY 3.1-like n=1 Tax=Oryza brachyantha TaxID=4533 RepID=UPI001ADC3304|nr:protein NRT1/ PTR FAMILY 3.1-like [Oryza brachyantha]
MMQTSSSSPPQPPRMETVEAAMADHEETKKGKSRKKGGFRTMPFIFANEVAEKLAVLGFSTNMLMYLTKQLHMPLAKAATTLTNFGGVSAMTPLIGAFLADAFVGRFWTIAAASLVYQLGMLLLTVSAALPVFRPPPCSGAVGASGGAGAAGAGACEEAAPWQLAVLYVALLLNALAAGGYRPCIVAFGADQFDESEAAERARTWGFFNWYYFCNGASQLVAVTAVVYVQDNVGWGLGLGVPTFCMAVSVVAFVAGYPLYRRLEPAGSPFTRLAQVVVAAVRKRRVPRAAVEAGTLYENDDMDAPISLYGKLVHTEQLSFFDRAAIVIDGDLKTDASDGKPPSPPVPDAWRLSTVHRVEELKSVLRMGPIWAAGILVITAASQQHTFALQQASTMDRRLAPGLSSFQIPAGSMTVFHMLAMLATLLAYDRVLVPLARRATGLDRGISYLHRMGVGFAVTVAATLVAGFVERRRRAAAAAAGTTDAGTAPLSAYWLVPQYALHGVAEAFNSVGHLEFMYDQSPESMRSMATALFWLSISLGSYVSTMLITAVHRWSAGADGSNWIPDNINHGRLEYLYWIVTLLQLLNLVYYVICAKCYTFKPLQLHEDDDDDHRKPQVELQEKLSCKKRLHH